MGARLVDAAKTGDLEAIRDILREHPNVDYRDDVRAKGRWSLVIYCWC